MNFRPYPKKGLSVKKAKTPIKRAPIKKKPENTGQYFVFEQIWNERERISFIDKSPLGNDAYPWMFAHVLPKAENKYPRFKLYKKNIVLLTFDQHQKWDQGSREELKKLPEWNKMFELEAELKEEYSRR